MVECVDNDETAEVVAQLRGVSTEELADTAARNACRLFGIPEE